MFNWLFEGWLSVYLLLAAVALALLAIWWSTRKRPLLIAVAVVAGLAGLYALLDLAVETDNEQLVRKVREMAASPQKPDLAGLADNLADDFHYNNRSKDEIIGLARNAAVREVVVWDFERGPVSRADRKGTVIFLIKVKSAWTPEGLFLRCKAHFVLDKDGQWRLQTVELFDPARNNERVDF
jgi:hypothetical protein